MTKKEYERQFELIDGGVWAVCEHLKGELWNSQIVKILNEQQTTISTLKEENEELKQKVDFYKYFQKDARELEKENEQLRQELQRMDNTDGWICGCCKHFYSGVRDRCDKGNNWVLKEGSCQDFER